MLSLLQLMTKKIYIKNLNPHYFLNILVKRPLNFFLPYNLNCNKTNCNKTEIGVVKMITYSEML